MRGKQSNSAIAEALNEAGQPHDARISGNTKQKDIATYQKLGLVIARLISFPSPMICHGRNGGSHKSGGSEGTMAALRFRSLRA